MCDNVLDLDIVYKIANEQYEASRERFKLKRKGLVVNTQNEKLLFLHSKVRAKKTASDKQILFDLQKGICPLCKLPLNSTTRSTIDHILPRSKGGGNDISNKQLTHSLCNNIKGDSTEYISPARYQDLTIELIDKINTKRKRKFNNY